MTIVANDSITVSNVNDGTITHTAWSYNADGSDGFTTVYPNLNLLDGTKDFGGTWTNSYTWIWATDETYKGLTVKKRTAPWNGIYKEFTAPKDGKYTFSTYVKSSGDTNIIRTVVINGVQKYSNWLGHDFDWNRDAITVDLKAGDVAFSKYEISTSNANCILWVAGYKWEEGSVATLWMPSANEITTADYPSYRGEYSDFSSTASIDPSKYSWSPMRGSSSYTAYSWSADGADRFTTVYPNSNLLTSKPFVMGYGIPNTTWDATNKVSGISLPITVIKSEVLPQDPGFPFTYLPGVTYTQSIYISTDAPLTGAALIFTWYTNQYGHKTTGSNNLVKVSTNVYRAIGTYTFPSSNSPADGRNADINNLTQVFDFTKGTFLQFYKPKLEQGSVASPYMISAKEDPLGVIPKYVGTAALPYDSYDKYEWKINPDWINQFNINQQSEIINAKNAADIANASISDMSKDSILTPIEKRKLLVDWTSIQSEYSKLVTNANKFGVSTTAYASAYSVLSGYILSLISNLTVNSTIVANTFKTNFKNYYDAKVDLMNNTNLAIQANMDALGTNTAYAYSADGTDRFTVAYPNLNLLKGTKTPKSITGNNTVNQGGLLYSFDNNNTLNHQGFNINDTVTLEFDWSATNPASGTFILQWQGQPWGFNVPQIKISSTNGSGHVTHTFNITDLQIASTAVATGIGYRFDNIPTNTVITFSNVIISKAKTSQPWMPSEKELTSDDIPKYVGYSVRQSENPKDFSWQPYGGLNSYNITKVTTAIDQNSKEIALKANKTDLDVSNRKINENTASIEIANDNISQVVTNYEVMANRVAQAESSITQNADSITQKVSSIDVENILTGKSYATQSEITQLSDNINLKVSKGDVVSSINQEAGQILLEANKLVLNANTTEINGNAFIDGGLIVDKSIKAEKMEVEDLSSISANIGKITAGEFTGINILSSSLINVYDFDFHGERHTGLVTLKDGVKVEDFVTRDKKTSHGNVSLIGGGESTGMKIEKYPDVTDVTKYQNSWITSTLVSFYDNTLGRNYSSQYRSDGLTIGTSDGVLSIGAKEQSGYIYSSHKVLIDSDVEITGSLALNNTMWSGKSLGGQSTVSDFNGYRTARFYGNFQNRSGFVVEVDLVTGVSAPIFAGRPYMGGATFASWVEGVNNREWAMVVGVGSDKKSFYFESRYRDGSGAWNSFSGDATYVYRIEAIK